MKFTIPIPLQQEHAALHERLHSATLEPGTVGAAAKELARLMHPHFVKEDEIALPPLGLLAALAEGQVDEDMEAVLILTDRLEADLPQMLQEHKAIVVALQALRAAAESAGRTEVVAFADDLIQHARTEEEVMYPAAVLVGRHVRLALAQRGRAESA